MTDRDEYYRTRAARDRQHMQGVQARRELARKVARGTLIVLLWLLAIGMVLLGLLIFLMTH